MLKASTAEDWSVCGQFEGEPWSNGSFYAVDGTATTPLRTLTDRLWEEYAYRQGHATARHIPPEKVQWVGQDGTHVYTIDEGWREYRVFNAVTDVSLDLDKTLGELGLRMGKNWIRFERAV